MLSSFYTLRCFATFFLCKSCHNCQSKFTVSVHCPNIILHKIHLNADIFQFSCGNKSVNGVSRKSADLTGYNQIKFSFLCVLYHLQKCRSLFRLRSCYSFIDIFVQHLPVGVIFRLVIVPFNLIFKSSHLCFVFGGHTAVKNHFAMSVAVKKIVRISDFRIVFKNCVCHKNSSLCF